MIIHFELFENAGKVKGSSRIVPLKKPLNGITMKNPLNGLDRQRAVDFMYTQTEDILKGRFRDESWVPINNVWKRFNEIGIEWESTGSQYFNFPPREGNWDSPRKEWYFKFIYINNSGNPTELNGTIVASGSDERFDVYDCWLLINN